MLVPGWISLSNQSENAELPAVFRAHFSPFLQPALGCISSASTYVLCFALLR